MTKLLIRNGRVIDPASGHDALGDVAISAAEVAAVHEQVLEHGEVGIEIIRLRYDADTQSRFAPAARQREAEELDLAGVG